MMLRRVFLRNRKASWHDKRTEAARFRQISEREARRPDLPLPYRRFGTRSEAATQNHICKGNAAMMGSM